MVFVTNTEFYLMPKFTESITVEIMRSFNT